MKPTSSARGLPTGRPSPLAASASFSRMSPSGAPSKSRKGPPGGSGGDRQGSATADAGEYALNGHSQVPAELLFQLQQLQQQQHQQHLQSQGVVAYSYAAPPPMHPMATGYPSYLPTGPTLLPPPRGPGGGGGGGFHQPAPQQPQQLLPHEDPNAGRYVAIPGGDAEPGTVGGGGDLAERLEKKDHMISQLSTFLHQMKQDSETTAHAWKEKAQEIHELRKQVTALTQQLDESRAREQATAQQLAQVTEDVELAVHGLKDADARHLEELRIMNEELQRRQGELEHVKAGYDESLRRATDELLGAQQQVQELTTKSSSLQETIDKLERGHQLALEDAAQRLDEAHRRVEQLTAQLAAMDNEKQGLAQHLWNVTTALEQLKTREQELDARLGDMTKDLEAKRAVWTEKFHDAQTERAELLSRQSQLEAELHEAQSRLADEQGHKEQLQGLMVSEMQRLQGELEHVQTQSGAMIAQLTAERAQWQDQCEGTREQLTELERQHHEATAELERLRMRLFQIDEENQRLQQHGTEKELTLDEVHEQLRHTLGELQGLHHRHEQALAQVQQLESAARRCLKVVSPKAPNEDEPLPAAGFPDAVLRALEDWQQQTGILEQMKLSMLRIQQDRDNEREKTRQREHELTLSNQALQGEVETTRADARALAEELQELTQRLGGNEAKLSAQIAQLTKDLDEARTTGALQVMQLQKSLESQRARTQQLESEKRELLHEAEQINASMEALYQAKNEKQVELDHLRASWKELQTEHADLKEAMEELEATSHQTMEELNSRVRVVHDQLQEATGQCERLRHEHAPCAEAVARLQGEGELLARQLAQEQSRWGDKERELQASLEDKARRMDEMMDMLTQLRGRNEFLEQARATDEQSVKMELDKYQQQLVALGQDKKRLELAYATAKNQHEQGLQELFALREEKRHATQAQHELEDALVTYKGEAARLQGELERLSRAKAASQVELHRVNDEAQGVLRQLEVCRRDARMQEKQFQDELERLRKENDELRGEASEATAAAEELQAKMTSVQTAANATINDLVGELQGAQDAITMEKARLHKENEGLKAQLRALDEESRRREADLKELQAVARQEREGFGEKESELQLRVSRLTAALEARKQDVDKLSKELETKGLKVAEYERKWTPLVNAKDGLQTKYTELKQALDLKIRDSHELEERFRDDLARVVKDKREIEGMYAALKEELELVRSQTSGQQQQTHSELRGLKQSLERTKAELVKANTDVLTLSQRLESCQASANETIAELSTRLEGADQQRELAVNALQREINLERERRREAEVQKMELQRLLRQRTSSAASVPVPMHSQSAPGTATSSSTSSSGMTSTASLLGLGLGLGAAGEDVGGAWTTVPAPTPPSSSTNQQPDGAPSTTTTTTKMPVAQSTTTTVTPPEYRKFYANEPMTNAELASLPLTVIKAQIGLDLAGGAFGSSSSSKPSPGPSKAASRAAPSPSPSRVGPKSRPAPEVDNNDEIPTLALEKLPQDPGVDDDDDDDAHYHDDNDDGDLGSSARGLNSEKRRSASAHMLAALSARSSSSDRYLVEPGTATSTGAMRLPASKAPHGSPVKKPTAKPPGGPGKKRATRANNGPSAAAAMASAYGVSPPKVKSSSKLLPRIHQ